ncbi:adaptor complexe medium subunit family protein [Cooperia oncophora]
MWIEKISVPPLMVIEFLHRVVHTFSQYFDECSDTSIKENCVMVFELLDEMLDNGYPLVTELNILQDLIKPPNFLRNIANQVTGRTNHSETLPTGQLSNIPWRRQGVKYTNNEAYFDVIEEIDAIIDRQGSTVFAEIQGYIDVCCKLSGMPDLTMTLVNPRLLDDVSFHPCVRFKRWENERVLSFVPPDGNFRLLSYHIATQNMVAIPIYVRHSIVLRGGTGSRLERKNFFGTVGGPKQQGRWAKCLEDVVVEMSMPKAVLNCNLVPSQGKCTFDPSSHLLQWTIGKIELGKPPNIKGTLLVQMLSTGQLAARRFFQTTSLACRQKNFREVLPPEEAGWAFNHIEKKRGLYKPKHTIEEQIAYMKSKAFHDAYKGLPIYRWYKRNFKGQSILQPPPRLFCIDRYGRFNVNNACPGQSILQPPPRLFCIDRYGRFNVNNACPVCRDEYLFFDYRNPALIEQFLSDGTHQPIAILKSGLCQEQYALLRAQLLAAKEHGTITFGVDFRNFDFRDWYKEWTKPPLPHMVWLRVSVFLLLLMLSEQKGKSDRLKKQEKKKEEVEKVTVQKQEEEEKNELPLSHPPSSISKQSILKGHETVDFSPRKFENPVLVYVTPWNNKGYDLAKWVSHKVTHVSPVWLQLKPQTADMSLSCRILGTHDIDHEWMEEVRKNNSDVLIVPRVLFDDWSVEDMGKFLQTERWMNRCLGDLMNLLLRTQFDGAVIELWASAMIQTRGEASDLLVEMLSSWGESFHSKNLQLIAPVGPPLGPSNQLSGMFTPAHLFALADKIDYIQMMTYDYRSDDITGVAPYNWVEQSVAAVLEHAPDLSKYLMIGLNHYGYEFIGHNAQPIHFDKYLEKLKREDSKLEWDSKSKEHVVKYDNTKIYYPSLTSIEMRLNLARKYGVGVAVWDFGQGLNYFTQVL